MAEEHKLATEGEVEVSDRGLFGFGKKEEKKEEEKKEEEEVLATGVERIKLDEREEEKTGVEKTNLEEGEEEKKHGILGQFHRSHSSSSSSSDEEEGEGENKVKKKKKNVLNEITEKFHKDGEEKNADEVLKEIGEEKKAEEPTAAEVVEAPAVRDEDSTAVVVEKLEDATVVETTAPEGEKKGFLDKIKEKLPGHGKKTPEDLTVTAPLPEKDDHIAKEEVGEKKGFLEKIKEKLPGYSPKSGVEESEKTNVDH